MRGKIICLDYIEDILDAIESVKEFIFDITVDDFMADKKTQYAVIRALEIIGEASKKIPPDIRSKYSDIPWVEMMGMRNKLIHEYSVVNLNVVWDTANKDIVSVKKKFEKIKSDLPEK